MIILFVQMSVVGVGDPHRADLDRMAGQPETQDVSPAQAVHRLSRVRGEQDGQGPLRSGAGGRRSCSGGRKEHGLQAQSERPEAEVGPGLDLQRAGQERLPCEGEVGNVLSELYQSFEEI